MKLILIASFSLFFALSLYSQDKVMDLSDFQELSASTSVRVDLIASNENRIEIDIEKGDIENLKIEESGDQLKIYWKSRQNWGKKRQANITLYHNGIDEIRVSAGANVYSNDVIKAEEFDAYVDSGGSLELELDAGEVDVHVNSGGRFQAEGVAETLEVDADSGGYFGGYKLKAKHVDASANSGGAAKVFASKSIKAKANSGGSIKYKGEPADKKLKKDKWSGGSISEY